MDCLEDSHGRPRLRTHQVRPEVHGQRASAKVCSEALPLGLRMDGPSGGFLSVVKGNLFPIHER